MRYLNDRIDMNPITIDLFAGAGGITQGFHDAGAQCLFANDFNVDAVNTFKKNFDSVDVRHGPIEELEPQRIRKELALSKGELDILVGGPPCQGFSINAPGRFVEDPRNSLFKHYLKFLDEFRPKTFMMENVTGMLSLAKGTLFQRIVNEFDARGYFCEARVLFAPHYGVPQERWRLILLGSRIGLGLGHPIPLHYLKRRANFCGGKTLTFRMEEDLRDSLLPPITVKDAIYDLPDPMDDKALDSGIPYPATKRPSEYALLMRGNETLVYNHVRPKISKINLQRLQHIQPGGSWRDIPHNLLPNGMRKARKSDHTKRYGRLHPDGLASTIMTKCDPHWGPVFHPFQERTLTVREAARFQSFPDAFRFTGSRVSQYEQVGNAVPPLLAKAICEAIKDHLSVTLHRKAV